MEKKKYSKPVVVAERFEPQEYCATCWWIDPSDMYPVLYEDGRYFDADGEYQSYEKINLPSVKRIPESPEYFKDPNLPQIASGSFYTSYETREEQVWDPFWGRWRTRTTHPYTSPATVYTYTEGTAWYNSTTYYFKKISQNNHS
ncbi:MAG: hypothetical protein ILA06_10305 [Bacteroidaceae bacterium]|nr:hypothetical protein [Bacteroidaceae bacterium]